MRLLKAGDLRKASGPLSKYLVCHLYILLSFKLLLCSHRYRGIGL